MGASLLAAMLLCIAGRLDVNGIVTVETRVGEAPLAAGLPPRAGVWGIATPAGELRYLSPRLNLRLTSGVTTFWREPNYLHLTRPLFLSVTELVAEARFTRRLALTISGSASIGEPDYVALTQILGPNQATIPQGVTELSSVVVGTNLAWQALRRLALTLTTDFTDRRQIGGDSASSPGTTLPAFVFPRQTSVVATPTATYLATREGDLIGTVPVSYGTYSIGSTIFTIAPTIGWRAHLSREVDLRLLSGLAIADLPTTEATATGAGTTASAAGWTARPVGEGRLSVRLLTRNDFSLGNDTSARVEYYVDPILGVGTPRGTISTNLALTLGPEWLLALNALFATSLAAKGIPLTPPPDETVVYVSLPIQHIIPKHCVIEFGARFVDSAPHYAGGFAFHQRQIYGYVKFTAMTRKPDTFSIPREDGAATRPSGGHDGGHPDEVDRTPATASPPGYDPGAL